MVDKNQTSGNNLYKNLCLNLSIISGGPSEAELTPLDFFKKAVHGQTNPNLTLVIYGSEYMAKYIEEIERSQDG